MGKEIAINPYKETKTIKEIICYPRCDPSVFKDRLNQLKKLNISMIISCGPTQIGRFFVLGKGCTSVVVKAIRRNVVVALKIRRTDADRRDLTKEAEILKIVNKHGIGPKLIDYTRDILVMEYVEGVNFGNWLKHVEDEQTLRRVLKKLFEELYILDRIGICHLELSNPKKHIVIVGDKPLILDFETVSTKTTKTNITQVLNYIIFRKNEVSDKIVKILGLQKLDIGSFKQLLKRYKKERTNKVFQELMKKLNMRSEFV